MLVRADKGKNPTGITNGIITMKLKQTEAQIIGTGSSGAMS